VRGTTFRPGPDTAVYHERLPVAPIVVATVVFMLPVAFMDRPALLVVVVVRMAPVCALIGRPLPHSSSPLIPPAAPGPITLCPNIAGSWHRSLDLVSQRWWSTTNINAHLSKCRSRNCRSQDRAHYPFCFDCLSPLKQPLTHSDPIPAKDSGLYRLRPGTYEATFW
jgi:hypothetical protein